jgi:hypothetical protein
MDLGKYMFGSTLVMRFKNNLEAGLQCGAKDIH